MTTSPTTGQREQIVEVLANEWEDIARLLEQLDDDAWSTPTELPGWDVRAVVAHIIGTEATLAGDPQPAAPDDLAEREHVRNDMGQMNEAWVELLRHEPPEEMVRRLREVTARRGEQLRAMTDEEFSAPSWTPAGNDTYSRFMQIRIFDCWMHEQDIRHAVGMPGNDGGPAAIESLGETTRVLGYVVGKLGRAPDGSAITFALTGPITREIHVVVDGRAAVVDSLERRPDVRISVDSPTFMRLAGGRVEARTVLDHIHMEGDVDLGAQIVGSLGYTI